MNHKFVLTGIAVGVALITVGFLIGDVYAKGLKVYLTIDSNQRPQEGTIFTYQHGIQVDSRYHFIDQGITQLTLQYDDDVIDVGEFRICVSVSDGVQGCSQGSNSKESKPERVTVNIHRALTYLDEDPQSQSQAQSSNNENNNANTQSQSQTTQIYICDEGGCRLQ